MIPSELDILVTHGPPTGHGGMTLNGDAGCDDLLLAVQKINPLVHVFGHIHEGYGVSQNKHTTFINASNLNLRYRPINNPVVFDIIPIEY